jgi:hypothetical protein
VLLTPYFKHRPWIWKIGRYFEICKITEKGPALEHIGEVPHIQGK